MSNLFKVLALLNAIAFVFVVLMTLRAVRVEWIRSSEIKLAPVKTVQLSARTAPLGADRSFETHAQDRQEFDRYDFTPRAWKVLPDGTVRFNDSGSGTP